jgi:cupin 2 domain-containing protein
MRAMMEEALNIFEDLPHSSMEENFAVLFDRGGVMIERIVSTGQASPPGFWYDQNWTEWVMLLAGAARLRFEDDTEAVLFRPGDHVLITPRRRHRIEWTQAEPPTLWLAVHIREEGKDAG